MLLGARRLNDLSSAREQDKGPSLRRDPKAFHDVTDAILECQSVSSVLAGGSLYAPELARAEATNIFRRLERAKLITTPEANAARNDLVQLDIDLFPFEPFADRIWELRHNVTSYDAWYVALAEALKLPLATVDGPLSKSNGVTCEFLTPGL